MTIQTQQDPPKPRETQKTSKHVGANGLHDDVLALKVDVAVLKEQGRHFATKEDFAKLEAQIAKLEAQIAKNQAENKQAMAAMDNKIEKARNDLLYAVNRATVRVIIVLVSMMVAFGGTLLTTLLFR